MPSSITGITFPDAAPSGLALTTAYAGRSFAPVGGNPKKYVTVHLYGPGRKSPEAARIEGLKLPTPLPAGDYEMTLRQQGETDKLVLKIKVQAVASTPPVVDGDPLPPVTPPVEQTPGDGPEWGACGNSGDGVGAVCEAITRIKADGGTVYRLWSSGYGKIDSGTEAIIRFAHAAGVKIILCCQPKRAPFGKPDFARFAKDNAAVLKLVWYVEAGNEINLSEYRPTDWSDHGWHQLYVDLWLRPLFIALRSIGVKTMCTSTTDTHYPENYAKHNAKLIAAGAKDCCDAVAIHVYTTPKFLPGVETLINDFCEQWDKPVHGTEMAPHEPTTNLSHYPPYLAACRRSKLASLEVYRGVPHSETERWPANRSMFDAKGRPTDVYRMTLEAFQ